MSDTVRVELLSWSGCPSHESALRRLTTALAQIGRPDEPVSVRWVETDAEAASLQFVGSPTFHVDGVDILPPATDEPPALTCRIYRSREGRIGPLPDRDDLIDQLRALLADTHPHTTTER